jgi:hypothetical protein
MGKQIRELSWFKPADLQSLPNGEMLGELDWINSNITKPDYSDSQVERMRNYRKVLEADYRRRKENRWM